jgi:hypothetical protein
MCITRSVQHPALRRHWSRLADPASVAALRSAVCDFAAGAGMTECLGDLRLAVSEAVTNSVVHAYREDRQRGQVSVTANLRDGCLEVVVADEGTGYRPRLDSPWTGCGPRAHRRCDPQLRDPRPRPRRSGGPHELPRRRRRSARVMRPTPNAAELDRLRAEARYHRERYDLYRAKAYGGRPTSDARLRELQRARDSADAQLREARAAGTPDAAG